jgi:hypothetical protein
MANGFVASFVLAHRKVGILIPAKVGGDGDAVDARGSQ